MKRLLQTLVIVLLTLVGLALVYQFRDALVMFFLSLAVAATFRPAIERVRKRGLPKSLAILIPYLFGIGMIGALVYFGIAAVLMDLREAADAFALGYSQFRSAAAAGTDIQQSIARQLPPIEALYNSITGEQGQAIATSILGIASGMAGFISKLIIVIVLSIYWNIDETRFERLWLTVLPASARVRTREIWRGIEAGVGSYVRSEVIQMILVSLLLALLYTLMGLPYPSLLAVMGALFWLIPWLGAVLAVIPPLLAGLAVGPGMAAAAALVTMLVLVIMEVFVEPRFFQRQGYSSILIALFMIALADVFGLVGILLAPPLAAAVQILFANLLTQPSAPAPADPLVQLTQLRARLLRLKEDRSILDDNLPQVDSWIKRLDGVIERAEQALSSEDRPPVGAGDTSV